MNAMPAGSAAAKLLDSEMESDSAGDDAEFLRIGEMSKRFDVTLRALRFYEDKGLLSPKREGANRLYSRQDCTRLRMILLGRKVGFTLRDVKHMIDLYDPSGPNTRQLKVTLERSTKQMKRLEQQRTELEDAIGDLAELMETLRSQLASGASKA